MVDMTKFFEVYKNFIKSRSQYDVELSNTTQTLPPISH